MKGFLRRTFIGGSVLATVSPARADTWPKRQLTWIVPFPQDSSADLYAQQVAKSIGKKLGQPIVIDRRTGAGGTLAATLFTRAANDDHTFMVAYTGLTYASAIYPKGGAGFDFARDFVAVSALGREPLVLVINPRIIDANDLQQFLTAARSASKPIAAGSDGEGTISHLAINLLTERSNIEFRHVPYPGTAAQLDALVATSVGAAFLPPHSVTAAVATGKLRALAVAARRRDIVLNGVPTFGEAGLDDFRVSQWFGIMALKQTSQSALDRMHSVIQSALETKEVKDIWARHGARVELESRTDFARFVASEVSRWARIAKAANIKVE